MNHAAAKKIPPPISNARRMALGTRDGSLASSVYMVIASKPMKEKATIVAPVMTSPRSTPSCHAGSTEKMVPLPVPFIRALIDSRKKTPIRTTQNVTSTMFTREVLVMLTRHMVVITAT